jgi:AcrR family transcriptional regulator
VKKVDHDARRQEVAIAAAHIIAEQGLEALTTRNLAKTMNCSIGVLSHYFANKNEIVMAALCWADIRIDDRLNGAIAENATLDQYANVIMSSLPLTKESDLEWRVRLNLAAYSLTHPELKESQRLLLEQREAKILSLITVLQQSDLIRSDLSAFTITRNAIDFVTGIAYNLLQQPLPERHSRVDFVVEYINALQG